VDDIPLLGRADDHPLRQHFLARYGAPAYVRRARRVQEVFEELIERCRRQRREWLVLVRARLAALRSAAGGWDGLRPWLADDAHFAVLEELYILAEAPDPPRATAAASARRVGRVLAQLRESIERFNRRWETFLHSVDLGPANEVRAGYNQYYILEKECAIRSPVLARQGFRRLEALTPADLAAVLPPLPVPVLKGR
jgi:hypothetical protein